MAFLENLGGFLNSLQPLAQYQQQQQDQNNLYKLAANPQFGATILNEQQSQRDAALKQLALQQQNNASSQTPSDVLTALWYQNASPEQKAAFDTTKRAQQIKDYGNGYFAIGSDGTATQVGPAKQLNPADVPANAAAKSGAIADAQNASDLTNKPKIAANTTYATDTTKNFVDFQNNLPKINASFESSKAKNDLLLQNIDKALPKVDNWTAGYAGKKLSDFGGADANDLRATLDTIKANVGFAELQNMRANSPTGGALGAVSENENKLLQSVITSLDQSQTPQQLKENLLALRKFQVESQARLQKAYEQDVNKFGKAAMNGIVLPSLPGTENSGGPVGGGNMASNAAVAQSLGIQDPTAQAPVMPPQASVTSLDQPAGPPAGAVLVGTSKGRKVYKLPNGQGWIE